MSTYSRPRIKTNPVLRPVPVSVTYLCMVDHGRVLFKPPRHRPTKDPFFDITGERFESISLPFKTTTGADHGPDGLAVQDIQV